MSGKPSRDKGYRRERELVQTFLKWGLQAERVPLSGATDYAKGDVDLYPRWRKKGTDAPFICEVKGRKEIPNWLSDWLGDADILVIHPDRKDRLYILPEQTVRALLCQ